MIRHHCIKQQTLVSRGACLGNEFLHSHNGLWGFPAWLHESGPSVNSFLWWQTKAKKTDGGNPKRETFPAVGEAELWTDLDRFTVCLILFRTNCFSIFIFYFLFHLFIFCLCTYDLLVLGCSPGTALAAGGRELQDMLSSCTWKPDWKWECVLPLSRLSKAEKTNQEEAEGAQLLSLARQRQKV